MADQLPSSGWYDDPRNPQMWRWWDGTQWTESTHSKAEQQPTTAPASSSGANSAISNVYVPEAVADKPAGGLFGRKKALEKENVELRSALAALGATEREQIRRDVELLTVQRAGLQGEIAHERQAATAELGKQLDKQRADSLAEGERTQQRIQTLRTELATLEQQVVATSDAAILQEVGIYEYSHPLDTAIAYKSQLNVIQDQIKTAAKANDAVVGATNWTVNNSQRAGTKMVKEFSKLMLRAYNNEADNAVRSMKPFALASSVARLDKARQTISKLGGTMQIRVTDSYHRMRIKELELTADYLAKKAEEKEREREEKARLREEEKAQKEFEREKSKLEKEASHYISVIAALREGGDPEELAAAEAKLAEITAAIKGVDDRAANTRAGYVYVISNVGSFGERMVKIGMTRRLEPMDRVRELGDASVPFRYDVHAMVFSSDAVSLETKLHQELSAQKVNLINGRREFFYATPTEVREVLAKFDHNLLSYEETPEALEWRQSENMRQVVVSV